MGDELTVRPASDDDIPAMIEVATRSLGWDSAEPNDALFRWKHLDNPAGRSAMWVATTGLEVVGFRTMLRWTYLDRTGPDTVERRAVRAVDTATDPNHQRKGIFRLLTETAIADLSADGTDFVFNTPNSNSKPGYLRMGWTDTGRLSARFLPTRPSALFRLGRARTAADKWSLPLDTGDSIDDTAHHLADLGADFANDHVATKRTSEHLLWRYGFAPMNYRVIQTDDAAAIIRLRRRGPATEAVVAEVMSPSTGSTLKLFRRLRRISGVDYLLTLASTPHPAPLLPTLPRLGPDLTLRDLASPAPAASDLLLSLGDIELF